MYIFHTHALCVDEAVKKTKPYKNKEHTVVMLWMEWLLKEMTSDPEIKANTWNEPFIQFTDFGFESRNTDPTQLEVFMCP